MTIQPQYLDWLQRLGPTVTLRELHADPARRDVVALRHDIDHDLDLALEMAHHEHRLGRRATYFLLHTHRYWEDEQLLAKCRQLEAYGHEVGVHLNVISDWMQGGCQDPSARLRQILDQLRGGGVNVTGTSAHGDTLCYQHGFINYWIWSELRGADPAAREEGLSAEGVPVDEARWRIAYPADHVVHRPDGVSLPLWGVSMRDLGLAYEAMHVGIDHYWTDTGGQFTRSPNPLEADLSRGRHQVLIHPFWWRGPQRLHFVFSTARCGSKWLANFVERATSCTAVHEWTLNHRRQGPDMMADKRTDTDYVGLVADRSGALGLIRQALAAQRTWPGDVLEANVYLEPFLTELAREASGATLLHLHRDGREVVRSLLNRGWYDTPGDRRHRAVPVDGWDDLTQLERCCWYYRFINERLMPCAARRLCFESMVSDPEYLRRELEALDIVVHPLLASEEFSKRLNENRSTSVPPFADWPEEYQRVFWRICAPVNKALGYPVPARAAVESLPTEPRPPARRSAETVFALDEHTSISGRRVGFEHQGGRLRFWREDPGNASSYLVLARGTWDKVRRKHGVPCDQWSYYVCRFHAEAIAPEFQGTPESQEPKVRLFVLWFDDAGRNIGREHVATMRPMGGACTAAFSPLAGASHLALGLHLGSAPPEAPVTLASLVLESVPLDDRYRVTPAGWDGPAATVVVR